jgi:hypothetical protein
MFNVWISVLLSSKVKLFCWMLALKTIIPSLTWVTFYKPLYWPFLKIFDINIYHIFQGSFIMCGMSNWRIISKQSPKTRHVIRYIIYKDKIPIRRGFAPGFVNYKKGALDSQPQVIKFTSCLPMVGGSLRVLRLPGKIWCKGWIIVLVEKLLK